MLPPAITAILAHAPPLNDLGPGKPVSSMRKELESLDIATAFAPHKIVDTSMAQACLAGLWLRFDFLDESHSISQDLHNSTGSFWHGIMHRREPDYENAKYWFRRVGDHPILESLGPAAREAAKSGASQPPPAEAKFFSTQSEWDPDRFVDLVATAKRESSVAHLCQQIQLLEWQLLFDFCAQAAIGGPLD